MGSGLWSEVTGASYPATTTSKSRVVPLAFQARAGAWELQVLVRVRARAWGPELVAVLAPATEPAQVWDPARGSDQGATGPAETRSWSRAASVSGLLRPETPGNTGGISAGIPPGTRVVDGQIVRVWWIRKAALAGTPQLSTRSQRIFSLRFCVHAVPPGSSGTVGVALHGAPKPQSGISMRNPQWHPRMRVLMSTSYIRSCAPGVNTSGAWILRSSQLVVFMGSPQWRYWPPNCRTP